MALRPGETPDSDELAAEDEVSEHTFNDRTAARPMEPSRPMTASTMRLKNSTLTMTSPTSI